MLSEDPVRKEKTDSRQGNHVSSMHAMLSSKKKDECAKKYNERKQPSLVSQLYKECNLGLILNNCSSSGKEGLKHPALRKKNRKG